MYAKRNSITIAVLWILLSVISFFWYSGQNKEIEVVRAKHKKLAKQLDGSLEIVQALEKVEQEHNQLRYAWEESPKKIIGADEPSFSLYYLNWIIQEYDIPLDFDFVLNSINEDGDITTFRFTLTGEGSYYNIYRLIMYLTENPLLYQIESYHFSRHKEKQDELTFKLQICGFSSNRKWENEKNFNFESIEPVAATAKFYDSFKSLRRVQPKRSSNMFSKKIAKKKEKKKPVDDGLLDVEKASLQAVANGQVYLKDKSGKIIKMKVGDKVHLGRLEGINSRNNEIEFKITEEGTTKKVILGLGYKK